MPHPVLVVTGGEVLTEVGAPAFGAGFGAGDHGFAQKQQVFQLHSFGEVVVKSVALIVNGDVFVALFSSLKACSARVRLSSVRNTDASSIMTFCKFDCE